MPFLFCIGLSSVDHSSDHNTLHFVHCLCSQPPLKRALKRLVRRFDAEPFLPRPGAEALRASPPWPTNPSCRRRRLSIAAVLAAMVASVSIECRLSEGLVR